MEKIHIRDREYYFTKDIKNNEIYRNSFFNLAKEIFEIDLENWYKNSHWDDNYIAYSLIHDDKVVANVSVNIMHTIYNDENNRFIQIGTVMTDNDYRKLGLGEFLIYKVIEEWKNEKLLYLYANEDVFDYYPKYNFIESSEYEYSKEIAKIEYNLRKLNLENPDDFKLLKRLYNKRNPFSELNVDNFNLSLFHLESYLKDNIYYLKEYDLIAVFEYYDEELLVYDIFGENKLNISLERVLGSLASADTKRVKLGFTPLEKDIFKVNRKIEEDTKLFVYNGDRFLKENRLILPLLSRA